MSPKYVPATDSIALTPTDDDHVWRLAFRDKDTDEDVELLLPMAQLEELDGEFRGLEQEFR